MNFDFYAPRHARGGLDASLSEIEQAELARRLPEQELSYLFKHALVQDSAYSTLMKQERKHLHLLVAECIERAYPGELDENAARLVQHYAEAGDDVRTFEYATRAGNAAARRFAYPEARLHYAHALDALARLPDKDEQRRACADTLISQVSVSLRAQGPAETLKRLTEAESLAQSFAERLDATREDRLRLARVHFWQGHALLHHNDTRAAVQKMRQVLAVGQAENDPQLLAVSASIVGRSLVLQGRLAQAIPILTDAITALEQTNDIHEWIFSVGMRGTAIALRGDAARGTAEAERTLERAQQVGTLTGSALAHDILALLYLLLDAIPAAMRHARALIETAAQTGDRLHSYLGHGLEAWAKTRAGDLDAAESGFAQAQRIADTIGGQVAFSDWFMAARAERELRRGAYAQAIALAQQALAAAGKSGSLFSPGLAHRVFAEALAKQDRSEVPTVESHFASAAALFAEGDAQIELARTRLAWGNFLRSRGEMERAQEHLEKAAAQFEQSGLTRELNETRALLETQEADA